MARAWLALLMVALTVAGVRSDALDAFKSVRSRHAATWGEPDAEIASAFHGATGAATALEFAHEDRHLGQRAAMTPEEAVGRFVMSEYGAAFGLTNANRHELKIVSIDTDELGFVHVHMAQEHMSIPVFGGDVSLHLDPDFGLRSVNGLFLGDISLETTVPRVTSAMAASDAADWVATQTGMEVAVPVVMLAVFREGLAESVAGGKDHLAYVVQVRAAGRNTSGDARSIATVVVDAASGDLLATYSRMPALLKRSGWRIRSETDKTKIYKEGDAIPTRAGFKTALMATEDAYNYFASLTNGKYRSYDGRDSGMGVGIFEFSRACTSDKDCQGGVADSQWKCQRSTKKCVHKACPNSWFDGNSQTYFCPGMVADDIVAHEWSHGYIQYSNKFGGLIYASDSGAISEALADIHGETVDQLNKFGEDGASTLPRTSTKCASKLDMTKGNLRWYIGEEIDVKGLFGLSRTYLRDMLRPDCTGSPDTTRSKYYICKPDSVDDLHENAGVLNRAYALMVDGVNGKSGIGLQKAAHIIWRVQTVYLQRFATYPSVASSLSLACKDFVKAGTRLNKVTTKGNAADAWGPTSVRMTSADCSKVDDAIKEVQMTRAPCGAVGSVSNLRTSFVTASSLHVSWGAASGIAAPSAQYTVEFDIPNLKRAPVVTRNTYLDIDQLPGHACVKITVTPSRIDSAFVSGAPATAACTTL